MAANIQTIAQLLDATLDPQQHRKAEALLKQEEKKPQYSLLLLKIVAEQSLPVKTRLASALAFKNYVRLNYVDEDGNHKLPADEVTTIKQELVGLMIMSPSNIQTQLGEAISVIADSDFWRRWDTLIQDLVSRVSPTDYKVNNGVLEVAHSIFVRWRPLFQSNELYEEINHAIGSFGDAFIGLLQIANQQIEANKGNADALKGWFETLSLLVKILYDVTCHDLPPVIETNLASILGLLDIYISYTNPIFDGDEDETTALENVKADICEALTLFATKYDDDFSPYCERFISCVWNLLSTIGPEKKYDLLISRALQFLTAVTSSKHAEVFNDENTLGQIVEKIILPNVTLRESDVEMFEDEPIEFIRRDLEGSDTDSRRRAATDFLRKLMEKFEVLVTNVVFKYIQHYLTQGQKDWKAKDTAIYLYLAIASKGAVTAAQGVKTVNPHVNVVEFFQTHIANDLLNDAGVEPISKVDAIKYLHNFRSQLTKDQWQAAFPPLIKNLASSNYVVYTYAAIAVERVLFLTNDEGQHLFSRVDIEPMAKDLLDHLFNLIEKDKNPAKMQENEFLMRCIMRVLIVINKGVQPILDSVLDHLIAITGVIKGNPSNPRFYYYLFEAIGALVRFSDSTQEARLQERLWDPFSYILNEDVSEFVPYVFQIFAALLEASPTTTEVPANFNSLLGPVLAPTVWETRGNVPGCARFLSAMIPRAKRAILENRQLEQILGVFQKLLAFKKMEQYAFDILEAVVGAFDGSTLDAYFPTILTLLFTKLQAQPADSYKQRFTRFYHLVSSRTEAGLGADYFIKYAEGLQSKIFPPIYQGTILKTTGQLARPVDRKLCVISYTKTMCDSKEFTVTYGNKGWGWTAGALLDLLKNPPKVAAGFGDDIITEADVDDISFGSTGYTPLNTCKRPPRDEFPAITDVQVWVSEYIKKTNAMHNGIITQFVQGRLAPEAQQALAPYLQ